MNFLPCLVFRPKEKKRGKKIQKVNKERVGKVTISQESKELEYKIESNISTLVYTSIHAPTVTTAILNKTNFKTPFDVPSGQSPK